MYVRILRISCVFTNVHRTVCTQLYIHPYASSQSFFLWGMHAPLPHSLPTTHQRIDWWQDLSSSRELANTLHTCAQGNCRPERLLLRCICLHARTHASMHAHTHAHTHARTQARTHACTCKQKRLRARLLLRCILLVVGDTWVPWCAIGWRAKAWREPSTNPHT